MDDADLINEVLELTLAYQRETATAEERARLERLLSDNPQAVSWYLRVVEDSLTLRAAAAKRDAQLPPVSGPCSTESLAGAECLAGDGPLENADDRRVVVARGGGSVWSSWGRFARNWAAPMTAASILLAVAGMIWWLAPDQMPANMMPANQANLNGGHRARIVNVSNVEWAGGAKKYNEWSFVEPGETLQLERGLVNLFFDNGAELLIEGPADVELVSLEKVYVRKGKLAVRISPSAVGFSVETPYANVTDLGTSFGVTVDENYRTDVAVYEGLVDLEVVGAKAPPRRLAGGEALSVGRDGELSRITIVESKNFLEPPQVRAAGARIEPVITSVSDNVRSLETTKYYRVIPAGFREDCRAYVDRQHEWNGVDQRGLPPFLVGGDYVMTYNDDKIVTEFEIAVGIGQPASLYVIIDDRVPPPEWLTRDFVDTHWDVGSDEGYLDGIITNSVGPGVSIDRTCSVWRRDVPGPTTVILGALSSEKFDIPASDVGRSMYSVVAVPVVDR